MKNLRFYLIFYRSKFVLPLASAIATYYLSGKIGVSIFVLLFISFAVFFIQHYILDPTREKLYLFFNQGMTEFTLYSFTFLLNLLILMVTFSVL